MERKNDIMCWYLLLLCKINTLSQKKDGFCTVRLSKSLLKFRKLNELLETLIHEMIHAYLFLTKKSYTRDGSDGHGKVSNPCES